MVVSGTSKFVMVTPNQKDSYYLVALLILPMINAIMMVLSYSQLIGIPIYIVWFVINCGYTVFMIWWHNNHPSTTNVGRIPPLDLSRLVTTVSDV